MSVRDALFATRYGGGLDFRVTAASPDEATGEMPVTEAMLNPFGTVHAGAMTWFADVIATVCAVGGPEAVDPDGAGFPLALNLSCVLLANTREGVLSATARPVRRGRKMIVMRTEVRQGDRLLMEMTSSHLRA